MTETAISDLYGIMSDQRVGIRQRINAAISASRVERLAMPGEREPQGVRFLRHVVAWSDKDGLRFSPQFRREAAAALAYFERRCKRAALQYVVPDVAERTASWRRLVNGALRAHLGNHGRWPADQHVLLAPGDEFEVPATDPAVALSALLLSGHRQQPKRRQKAIDERVPGSFHGNEEERAEQLRQIAKAVHRRLAECGLG